MHDLNDKLFSIDYQKEFVRQYKCPPINRYYFCRQTNSGQQFYTFCSLSSFLLQKLNANIKINVEEFDDPNVTINNIIESAKNFIDVTIYYNNANKLRLGFGHEVITLLNNLIDKVIDSNDKNNDNIIIKGCDDFNDENVLEELTSDDINAIDLVDEDYDYNLEGDKLEIKEEELDDIRGDIQDVSIMKSDMDLNEWKVEVERVLPQLRIRIDRKNMDNEWRTHYNLLSTNYKQMKIYCDQTFGSIDTLLYDLRTNEEKVNSREKYLKQQLEDVIEEFVSVRSKVSKLRDDYSLVSSGVVEKSSQLAEVTQMIDSMKQEMELYGNQMTDSSPLIVAKKAKEVLKEELNAIELQIGVAVQTLIDTFNGNTFTMTCVIKQFKDKTDGN
ncbi:intraflagellar transport protein 57 homolog [Oppia nitens]|uniref:intraflagellar transport protein 57 homolog n=1 Tax=Oppia nitens TaxID=1686743 RepID=UPI0023DC16D4|nr:intraflagellar transport protein 57 homolog [Oppia nitens]